MMRTKIQSIEDRLQVISLGITPKVSNSNQPATVRFSRRIPKRQAGVRVKHIKSLSQQNKSALKPGRLRDSQDIDIVPDITHSEGLSLPAVESMCPEIDVYEQSDQTIVLHTRNYSLHETIKPAMLLQKLVTSF